MFESDEEYYADREYLTNSSLKLLNKSPIQFYMWLTGKGVNPSSNALEVGKAFHALVLEEKEIFVGYEGTRRGKEYMRFKEDNSDKIVLSQSDAKMLYTMRDTLHKCPEVRTLMYNDGDMAKVEVPATGIWSGIKIKGKADMIVEPMFDPAYIVDVKTTGGDLSDFARSARYMGYDQQAAVYTELFNVDQFYFVVITKSYPYEIGIYECSAEFLYSGQQKVQQAINKYKKLFLENEFKPFSATEISIL